MSFTQLTHLIPGKRVLGLLAVLVFAFTPVPAVAQNVAWDLKAGDNFEVTFEQDSIVTSEFNQIQRRIGTKVTLVMDWNVASVGEDSVASIEQSIARIQMTLYVPAEGQQKAGLEGQVNEISIDTSAEEEAEGKLAKDMLRQIKPLVGAGFDVQLNPAGEILAVSAPDATLEMLREIPGSMKLRELLTPEGLKSVFGQSNVVLPKSDFETGHQWAADRSSTTAIGEFAVRDEYTFEGESEFEGKSYLTFSLASSTTLKEPAGKAVLNSSTGQGKLFFDAEAGHFAATEFVNEYSITQPIRESQVDTNTVSTVKMRMVKKN